MSHRKPQIESTLQRAISVILGSRLADPRLQGTLASVTAVRLTDDLLEAQVLVSVVPAERQTAVLAVLQRAAGHVAADLRRSVKLRTLPRLRFKLDASLKTQDRVYDALREASARSQAPSDRAPERESSPPERAGGIDGSA